MRGFTLPELLIVIALVALMATLAAPAARGLHAKVLVAAGSLQLLSALRLARTRAVVEGTDAVLCPAAGAASDAGCGDAYRAGWLAFSDRDGDRDFDAGVDRLLRAVSTPGSASLAVRNRSGETFAGRIVYRRDGTVSSPATLQLCPPSAAGAAGRRLVISMTGRVRTVRSADGCAR